MNHPGRVTQYRLFRTASDPEFVAYEIEPALVERGLSASLAPAVAGMMDGFGYSVAHTIAMIEPALRSEEADAQVQRRR